MEDNKIKCRKRLAVIKYVYEEMMTNNDNLESSLLASSLLKICSLQILCRVLLQVAHVELDICVEVIPTSK